MCWRNYKDNVKVETAGTDIKVFKIGKVFIKNFQSYREIVKCYRNDDEITDCYSFITDFFYKVGETYETETDFDGMENFEKRYVSGAFHSYDPKIRKIEIDGSTVYVTMWPTHKRIFYDKGMYAPGFYVPILMNCVIPKGARYIENEVGEIVSDRIRVEGMKKLYGSIDFNDVWGVPCELEYGNVYVNISDGKSGWGATGESAGMTIDEFVDKF